MRIRIACGLDSRSWAGFWKNDRAAVRAVRTIQCNNLLFHLLFILYNIYNLLFIRLAVTTHNWIAIHHPVTQSLSSLSSPSSSHRMSSSDPSKALLMQLITVKALVTSNIIQLVCLVSKGRLKESCGLEPRTNFFFPFKKSAKTSAD